MKIKSLQDLHIFVLTAETGSLSAAARQLNLSPAVASASIKRLESELSTVLFFRTTRNLRLSPQGMHFLPAARLALESLGNSIEEMETGGQVVRDTLQISMPSDLGRNCLLNWIDEFQLKHPQVSLRVQLTDRVADLYSQPVDLAIRYGFKTDSGLVAIPLAPDNRRALCASPDYLARCGTPQTPIDLAEHNCLRYHLSDDLHEQWQFEKNKRQLTVPVSGNRTSDDGEVVHRWALAGLGVAYKSYLDVAGSLANGHLVRLCPDWVTEHAPLSLICADRRQLSITVVLLRDHLRARLTNQEKNPEIGLSQSGCK